MTTWQNNELAELSKESFDLLLDNKIPGIKIDDFIAPNDCDKIGERLAAMKFAEYDHLDNIPVRQLGVCQNQFANEPKSVYFNKVAAANREVDEIFAGIIENPIQRLIKTLGEKIERPTGIATEDGYGEYFAGAFRSFSGHGKLHVDHAPTHVTTDWSITKVVRQLTWNIYYLVPEQGGEVVIYDTVHNSVNEKMKVAGDYYFPYEVLENDICVKIKPKRGQLIIFNTQNFHEILGTPKEKRISHTSFMGVDRTGSLKLWS